MDGEIMNVEILISTMHQIDYSILDTINIQTPAVVINQCDSCFVHEFDYKGNRITWVDTKERGLSRSRNMAIRYSRGDICVLVDDDEQLVTDYEKLITTAFIDNPKASVISFQVKGIDGGEYKPYPRKKRKIGYFDSMKLSSVELCFRRTEIQRLGIEFNTEIGAGTRYLMGEENAFLFQCLSHKLKIVYEPKAIARLHISESTWFTGFNAQYMIAKGAVFTAMSRRWAYFLIAQFALRKKRLYCNHMNIKQAYCYMLEGRKEYLVYYTKQRADEYVN